MPTSNEQHTVNDNASKKVHAVKTSKTNSAAGGLAAKVNAIACKEETFEDHLRQLAREFGGEFLFGLPASGLIKDCNRIAAVRLPSGDDKDDAVTEFILLKKDSDNLQLLGDKDQIKDLEKFANAFVDVLGRLGPLSGVQDSVKQTAN